MGLLACIQVFDVDDSGIILRSVFRRLLLSSRILVVTQISQ
jgi:hypothetical protein